MCLRPYTPYIISVEIFSMTKPDPGWEKLFQPLGVHVFAYIGICKSLEKEIEEVQNFLL